MNTLTLETCMDILDWFDDDLYDYITHILLSKLDGEERVRRALPELRRHALELVAAHTGTETTYPCELLNQPA